MILTDNVILKEIGKGNIVITPFRKNSLGSNSYDVHLGETLAIYEKNILDARQHNKIRTIKIPESGFVLQPNEIYLGVTEEYTETYNFVPFLEGKSSIGRLGIDIHATAGKGDLGFCNHWTLELSVKRPVRVYAGMAIGQLIYFKVLGNAITPYNKKPTAKYNGNSKTPIESMAWKDYQKEAENENK